MGLFIFILGLIIGSFLNVVILRFNTGESIVVGQSKCYSCGAKLNWYELIPVLSFIFLKCRCGRCKSKISWQYPLVEILTALIFYFSYLKWSLIYPTHNMEAYGVLLWWFVWWAFFLVLTVYDFYHKILPDSLSYLLSVVAFIGVLFFTPESFLYNVGAGLVLSLFLASLWFVSRGKWMGLGDAKLFFAVGVFLGPLMGTTAMFLSFWIGAIISSILTIYKRSLTLKSEIPFAPFIFAGVLVAFLWGEILYELYIKIIL